MKKQSRKIVLVVIIMIISVNVWAQQGRRGAPAFTDDTQDASSGSGTGSNGLPAIPLDGGLSLLLVAGAAYGAKRKIRN